MAYTNIKTVVVLVQENRSFDHMLGWMKELNPDIDGVDGTESNPLSTLDTGSKRIMFTKGSKYVDPDPGHSIQDIYEQIFGQPWDTAQTTTATPGLKASMQGFAQNAERNLKGMSETVMTGFEPESVSVYKELIREFAVCDRWFASVPASTQPNRMFVHSATSHGASSNDTKKLIKGFPQKTIFESLNKAGLSFGIYYQYPPATLFFRNLRKLKYLKKFHEYDLHFKNHCKEGKLPNYVVIEQRYFDLKILPGNDDHPSHDVFEGQKFVKEVYEALRSSPQWNEMLFVIIYDEHGGFYDHVPIPVTGIPSPDGLIGPEPYNFKFDRLGVRIPAILISPWIEKGTVLHGPSGPYSTSEFEHSSIPATIKKIFNLNEFLTKRDAWAGTFEGVLRRSTPRKDCPVRLSEPVKFRKHEPKEDAKLTDFQKELVQMAAALCADHKNDIYPHKLVDNMTVSEGVKYVENAFAKFLNEDEQANRDDTGTNNFIPDDSDDEVQDRTKKSKSLASKFLSCIVCGTSS